MPPRACSGRRLISGDALPARSLALGPGCVLGRRRLCEGTCGAGITKTLTDRGQARAKGSPPLTPRLWEGRAFWPRSVLRLVGQRMGEHIVTTVCLDSLASRTTVPFLAQPPRPRRLISGDALPARSLALGPGCVLGRRRLCEGTCGAGITKTLTDRGQARAKGSPPLTPRLWEGRAFWPRSVLRLVGQRMGEHIVTTVCLDSLASRTTVPFLAQGLGGPSAQMDGVAAAP